MEKKNDPTPLVGPCNSAAWDEGPRASRATAQDLAPALALLRPVALQFHNASSPGEAARGQPVTQPPCRHPTGRARPQLDKLAACFALVR